MCKEWGMPAPTLRHTRACEPTWWEKRVGRLTGFYPRSFVDRRMAALHADESEYAEICKAWLDAHRV